MKRWQRYGICIALGLVGGAGYAISQVRGDYTAKQISNGPWNANTIQGTEKATALIRAKVALHGIMALPQKKRCIISPIRTATVRLSTANALTPCVAGHWTRVGGV